MKIIIVKKTKNEQYSATVYRGKTEPVFAKTEIEALALLTEELKKKNDKFIK